MSTVTSAPPPTGPSRRQLLLIPLVAALLGAVLAIVVGPISSLGDARSGDAALAEETASLVGEGDGLRTLAVARVTGGEVTHAGLGDLPDGTAPTPDTVYELGSITKVFTGMLLADAVERGEMDLDAPVSTYLPELAGTPAGAATPRQLATHTSGMPRLLGGAQTVARSLLGGDVYAADTTERFLDQAATAEFSPADPADGSAYSNAGAALLGHATARAAGAESWIDLLEERLTTPLGMDDTTIMLPGTPEPAHLAGPHRANGMSTTPWTGDGYAPAGSSTRTTAADMTRFAAALLDGSAPGMSALEPIHTENGTAHGLGWVVQETEQGTVTWHNGGTAGSRTMLALDRATGTAALVLGNTDQSVDDLGIALAQPQSATPPVAAASWGMFTALPLVAAAVLVLSAWFGARGAASRLTLGSQAIDAAVGGIVAWAWGPWHLMPHALVGVLPGLAVGVIVAAVLRMPSVPLWPARRARAVVSLAVSVLILVGITVVAWR